jgi:hypothetical protein
MLVFCLISASLVRLSTANFSYFFKLKSSIIHYSLLFAEEKLKRKEEKKLVSAKEAFETLDENHDEKLVAAAAASYLYIHAIIANQIFKKE